VPDDALEAALKQLLHERAELDVMIAGLQRRLGKPVSAISVASPSATGPTGGPSADLVTYPGEFHLHSLPSATEKILRRVGRPLKTMEILAALKRAEFEIKAKAPVSNLYTALVRSPVFIKVRPNTWALSEWHPESAAKAGASKPKKRRSAAKQRRAGNKVVGIGGPSSAAPQGQDLKKAASA
jgi:hypothetical protein